MIEYSDTDRSRILVIDDDEDCRELLVNVLKARHFYPVSADIAETALDMIKDGSFDAVISDISLPGMSGIDLLRRIRETDDDLPVILITGHSSLDTAVHAVKEGASDYLIKPLTNHTTLTDSLNSAIKNYQEKKLQAKIENMLTEAVERERQTLGRELHDSLSQDLASISMLASMLADNPDAQMINRLAHNCISCIKCLCSGLFPVELEDQGLGTAIRQLAKNCQKMTEITCTTDIDDELKVTDKDKALHLFRITQEAFKNALKHSEAKRIDIRMKGSNSGGEIRVTDDGSGIDYDTDTANKMGIHIMQYRANIIGADLQITSSNTNGTEVKCKW